MVTVLGWRLLPIPYTKGTTMHHGVADLTAAALAFNKDYYSNTKDGASASFDMHTSECRKRVPRATYIKNLTALAASFPIDKLKVTGATGRLYDKNGGITEVLIDSSALPKGYGFDSKNPDYWIFEDHQWRIDDCTDLTQGLPWVSPGSTLEPITKIAAGECLESKDAIPSTTGKINFLAVVDCSSKYAKFSVMRAFDWSDNDTAQYGVDPASSEPDTFNKMYDICGPEDGNYTGQLFPSAESFTAGTRRFICFSADTSTVDGSSGSTAPY